MTGHFNYILICSDGTLYSGYAVDPKKRLAAHNTGRGAKYTRSRLPVKLAALWQWPDKNAAMKAELFIKSLTRDQKLTLVSAPETIEKLCAAPLKFFSPDALAPFSDEGE